MLSAQSGRSGWEYLRVNTATGAFLPSGVAGVTYNGLPVGTDVPGYVTVNLHYTMTGAWKGGTLHLLAWNNAQMNGMTVFNQSYTYAEARGMNTIQVPNTALLVGSTYWYAWLDADGDGGFNNKPAIIDFVSPITGLYYMPDDWPFNEPAAQAEHMPATLASVGGYATVNIWLVDWKGNTIRHGSYMDRVTDPLVKITLKNVTVGFIGCQGYLRNHDFLIEAFYTRTDSLMNIGSGDAGPWTVEAGSDRISVGGVAWDWGARNQISIMYGNADAAKFTFGEDRTVPIEPSFPWSAKNQNAPVAAHPTAGEMLSSNTIEFSFTGQWKWYSAMQLDVLEDSSSGTSRYAYTGYMENEHYDDGTTRHMARNLALTAGKTYYWRVRCVYGHPTDGDWLPTAYSSWATFVYQP